MVVSVVLISSRGLPGRRDYIHTHNFPNTMSVETPAVPGDGDPSLTADFARLPADALVRIFEIVLSATPSPLPSAPSAAKSREQIEPLPLRTLMACCCVCKAWRHAALHPSLWASLVHWQNCTRRFPSGLDFIHNGLVRLDDANLAILVRRAAGTLRSLDLSTAFSHKVTLQGVVDALQGYEGSAKKLDVLRVGGVNETLRQPRPSMKSRMMDSGRLLKELRSCVAGDGVTDIGQAVRRCNFFWSADEEDCPWACGWLCFDDMTGSSHHCRPCHIVLCNVCTISRTYQEVTPSNCPHFCASCRLRIEAGSLAYNCDKCSIRICDRCVSAEGYSVDDALIYSCTHCQKVRCSSCYRKSWSYDSCEYCPNIPDGRIAAYTCSDCSSKHGIHCDCGKHYVCESHTPEELSSIGLGVCGTCTTTPICSCCRVGGGVTCAGCGVQPQCDRCLYGDEDPLSYPCDSCGASYCYECSVRLASASDVEGAGYRPGTNQRIGPSPCPQCGVIIIPLPPPPPPPPPQPRQGGRGAAVQKDASGSTSRQQQQGGHVATGHRGRKKKKKSAGSSFPTRAR